MLVTQSETEDAYKLVEDEFIEALKTASENIMFFTKNREEIPG